MTKPKTYTSAEAAAIRDKLGLNQSEFWGRLGVTQSGGSRYESGRKIPRPVQRLIAIAYGTDKQSADAVAALRAR
jgi:DNA-binding transcriptional regulator YiaG